MCNDYKSPTVAFCIIGLGVSTPLFTHSYNRGRPGNEANLVACVSAMVLLSQITAHVSCTYNRGYTKVIGHWSVSKITHLWGLQLVPPLKLKRKMHSVLILYMSI